MHIKKLILLLFLVPVLAQAQKTTGPNYTYIAQRYEWLAGVFKALGIPAGDSAQFQAGQEMRSGALYYDSTGVDAGLKVWNGAAWVGVGEVTQSALDDTAAAIRGDFPAGGFFTPNQTSTGATVHNASLEDFTLDSVGTFSIKRNAITRFLLNGSETTIQSPDGLTFLQAANTGISVFAGPTSNNGRMSLGDNVASFGIESSYTTGLTLVPSLATLRNTTGSLNIQAGGGASDSLRLIHFNYSADTTTYKLQARNPVTGALVDTDWPEAPNLLFDSLGTDGISPVTVRDDTLMARRISVTGGLTVDTTASGGLVIDASGVSGGSGITELNTLTGATQTFATGTTGTAPNISSSGTTHTFNFPDAGSGITQGMVTNGTQTFVGAKTLSGTTTVTGVFTTATSSVNANLAVASAGTATATSQAELLFGGASTISFRVLSRGNVGYTIPVNNSYGSWVEGVMATTEGSSGTHALNAGHVFKPQSITNGSASTTDATTVYIEGAPTGTATITNGATSLWIDDGISRFDGMFASGTTSLTANQIWGANSGATAMEGKTLTNGQNIKVTHGAGTATFAGATLTKNAMVENPTASENLFMFRTPVAITVTDVTAVLVGGTPSVTYNIAFGTDRTSGTNVYTAGQTVTSETTGTAASGVNDATIPAGSWVWITTSAATDVTQLNISLTYTED